MTRSWRFSTLIDRHRALGSKLEDWSGMGTAWSYSGDADEEYIAIRTKAGLMDVSGLKKVHITGPHAAHLIDLATTRDVEKIYPGKSAYACMLNEAGKFTDDCIIYRTGPNSWMVVHGSGTGHEELQKAAMGRDVSIRFDDNLHDLSLQGPLAVDYLAKHVPGIRDLPYFHHMQTQLFGLPVMISRTGYTGERGYEIFCRGQDAGVIWDRILDEGKSMGIIPCRFTTLDMLRVESYLLFYPYDNSQKYPVRRRRPRRHAVGARPRLHRQPRQDRLPRRRGALSPEGQGALQDLRRAARRQGAGRRRCAGPDRWRQVGVVTCAMYSPLAKKSMGIARLPVNTAMPGTPLEINNTSGVIKATAEALPFDDPKKTKRTAKG